MKRIFARLSETARSLLGANRGNVAMMFGIALVPLTIAGGVGLDYARSAVTRSQMADAMDAAALAVGSSPGLDQAGATKLAQKYFNANYTGDTSNGAPVITVSNYNSTGTVTLHGSYNLPATLLKVMGKSTVGVSYDTTVVWGQSKLWVALVLDNSGSMSQGDSSGTKMDALQNASHSLLTTLQAAASTEGDVKVTIVPFANLVNVNGVIASSYIDWREWDSQPPLGSGFMTVTATLASGIPFQAYGPLAKCPFDGTDGYVCGATGVNDPNNSPDASSRTNTDVANVPATGLICPGMHGYNGFVDGNPDRFYNGCYTSVLVAATKVNWTGKSNDCNNFPAVAGCSCTGSGTSKACSSQKYTHVWTVNLHATWGGCVADRQKSGSTTYGAGSAASSDYDVFNTAPGSGDTLYPALNTNSCLATTVLPMPSSWSSSQWTTLSNKIDAMTPGGATNQALGIEHGWQTLTPGNPYGAPAVPANTARYIIIFSDGQNTQDRWWGNGRTESNSADANIDTRTTTACANAKADGVVIYSVYVNVGGNSGNSAPLQTCASDSSKYFALTSTSAIVTTFNQIAQQITNVRVSK